MLCMPTVQRGRGVDVQLDEKCAWVVSGQDLSEAVAFPVYGNDALGLICGVEVLGEAEA